MRSVSHRAAGAQGGRDEDGLGDFRASRTEGARLAVVQIDIGEGNSGR